MQCYSMTNFCFLVQPASIVLLYWTLPLLAAKYREYHLLHEKRELVEAGALLIALLVSDSVPRR